VSGCIESLRCGCGIFRESPLVLWRSFWYIALGLNRSASGEVSGRAEMPRMMSNGKARVMSISDSSGTLSGP